MFQKGQISKQCTNAHTSRTYISTCHAFQTIVSGGDDVPQRVSGSDDVPQRVSVVMMFHRESV